MLPFSFRLFATYDVPCAVADKKFHDLLGEFERSREEINGKTRRREFFKASPEAIFQNFNLSQKYTEQKNACTDTTNVNPQSKRELTYFQLVSIPETY